MPTAHLRCIEESCRRQYPLAKKEYSCAWCGGLLEVCYQFDPVDPDALRQTWHQRRLSNLAIDRSGVWRFRELLPFLEEGAQVVTLLEGSTSELNVERSSEWAGGVRLAIKHQGNNPTGSFKDLGMTACITQAASLKAEVVACASTGNTSASMAAYAARTGMKALVCVPHSQVSLAKLAQAIDLGAFVVEIEATFDEVFRLLRALTTELSLYLVNSTNPFRIEGQKTIVAELLEQRSWQPPDYVVVPGGGLGNAASIGKGLADLRALGMIERVPRLVVVQAAGANPFHQMVASGFAEPRPLKSPETEASAIRIGDPANWKKALRALEWTNGLCESVTDEEIFEAKSVLAQDGIGCEPASAATLAGVRKLQRAGKIEPGADVVAILTGHQLKDTEYILRRDSRSTTPAQRMKIPADLGDLRRVVESWTTSPKSNSWVL